MKTILLTVLTTLAVVAILGAASTLIGIGQIRGGGTGTFVLQSVNGVNSWSVPPTAPNFSDAEVPTGTVNGTNAVFTLAHQPVVGSNPLVIRNIPQSPGNDYTISGSTITFASGSIPQTGDTVLVWYRF